MPDPSEGLTWSVRPVEGAPGLGVAAGLIVVITVVVTWFLAGPFMGCVALLLVGGGVGSFFVRTRYRLTPDAVEVDSPFLRVKRPWSAFRRAYVGRDGVSLSPFPKRHLLEPYRSVMLRFGTQRDDVLSWVRRFGPGESA